MEADAHLDVETRSPLDLKRVGLYRYFEHPHTSVTMLSYSVSCGDVGTSGRWCPGGLYEEPDPLLNHIRAGGRVKAHNAAFERRAWKWIRDHLHPEWPELTIAGQDCTMSRGMALALPGKLEMMGKALQLDQTKDTEGHRLMRTTKAKTSSPTASPPSPPSAARMGVSDGRRSTSPADRGRSCRGRFADGCRLLGRLVDQRSAPMTTHPGGERPQSSNKRSPSMAEPTDTPTPQPEGLKSCPFCGGPAGFYQTGPRIWIVECQAPEGDDPGECNSKPACEGRSEAFAIGAWNRRAHPQPGGELHPATAALVQRFSAALASKLRRAEEKYGYTDGWLDANWQADCVEQLRAHVEKGDPLDVAAYAAFCWHHHWPTNALTAPPREEGGEDEAYEVGKQDGFADAVQRIDLETGGDGEYRASSDPERHVPDAEAMMARIRERFGEASLAASQAEVARLREALRLIRSEEVQGSPAWNTAADALARPDLVGRAAGWSRPTPESAASCDLREAVFHAIDLATAETLGVTRVIDTDAFLASLREDGFAVTSVEPAAPMDVEGLVERLRAPAYWISAAEELADTEFGIVGFGDRTLAAEAARLRDGSGDWQPIETAPRDRHILAYADGYGPMEAHWEWGDEEDCEGWIATYLEADFNPTHWMPLPGYPALRQGAADGR